MQSTASLPRWARLVLSGIFLYYLLFFLTTLWSPNLIFRQLGMDAPNYAWLVQLSGILTGVFALGFLFALRDPIRNSTIILLGLIAQITVPVAALIWMYQGQLRTDLALLFVVSDGVWILPLYLVLRYVSKMSK